MILALGRRSMGDALSDELAGAESDGLVSRGPLKLTDDNLMVPSWATSSSSAPPVNVTQGNTPSAWSWSDIGKTLVSGVVHGLVQPQYKPAPSMLSTSSGGMSTGAIVAGAAVVGLALVLILRRR